ncbi:MAG: hypothetical protein GY703_22395 [Gammaproteobacteria bacterium]|nr:hypothetical protein [Gammaproteobacteria bacterium]
MSKKTTKMGYFILAAALSPGPARPSYTTTKSPAPELVPVVTGYNRSCNKPERVETRTPR